MIEQLNDIPATALFQDMYSNELLYHDAVWLTAHNAFANKEDGWYYAQQNMNLIHMFEQGVRSFMIDVREDNGTLLLCHGECQDTQLLKLGAKPDPLENWFQALYEILSNNTKEILTLHIESYASSKNIYSLLAQTHLDKYLFNSTNPNDNNLTLGYMRQNDERLVIFSDYAFERGARSYTGSTKGMYLGIYPTLNYKETQYSLDLHDGCEMRTDFRAHPADRNVHLMVFNHFTELSAVKDYDIINKYSFIIKRVQACLNNSLFPNFIAVDYFEKGDCTDCVSTKNVVFTLNSLSSALKGSSPALGAPALTKPSYILDFLEIFESHDKAQSHAQLIGRINSHTASIIDYLLSYHTLFGSASAFTDYLVYKLEKNIQLGIESIHTKNAVAFKRAIKQQDYFMGKIPSYIHMITEASLIYNAFALNEGLGIFAAALLAYHIPSIYKFKSINDFQSRLVLAFSVATPLFVSGYHEWCGEKALFIKNSSLTYINECYEWGGQKVSSIKNTSYTYVGNCYEWSYKNILSIKDSSFTYIDDYYKWGYERRKILYDTLLIGL